MVKFFLGITNFVGNSHFSLIVLLSLTSSFGDGIARVASDCLTNFLLGLTISSSLYQVIFLYIQTGLPTLGVEQNWPRLKCGHIPTVCILQSELLSWN